MKHLACILLDFSISFCSAQVKDGLKAGTLGSDQDYAKKAKAYFDNKDYGKAAELYSLIALQAEQNGASDVRIDALSQLASIHEIKKDYTVALDYLRRAYDIADSVRTAEKTSDNTPEKYSHDFMTDVMGGIKRKEETSEELLKTIAVKTSLNDTLALSINYFNLGRLYKSQQMYPQALDALENSLTYAQKIYFADMQLSAVNEIVDLYEFTGNSKQALAYLKKKEAIVALTNLSLIHI